jgi:GNAT superfamily N-acetyltransferase
VLSPYQIFRRLANGIRYDGLTSVVAQVALMLCSRVVETDIQVLLVKDLTLPLSVRAAQVPLEIRTARAHDIPWIVSELARQEFGAQAAGPTEEEWAHVTEFYLSRLRRGEKLFFGCVGGELAHVNWTCFRWGEALTGMPVVLLPGEIYTTDAVTTPHWRGKGVHEAVLNEMLRVAAESGYKRAFTLADITNRRSLRGVRRLGWDTYGIALYMRPRGTKKVLLFCLRGRLDPLLRELPFDDTP